MRHAHAADTNAARLLDQAGDGADRVGHRRDLLATLRHRLDDRWREAQPVEQRRREAGARRPHRDRGGWRRAAAGRRRADAAPARAARRCAPRPARRPGTGSPHGRASPCARRWLGDRRKSRARLFQSRPGAGRDEAIAFCRNIAPGVRSNDPVRPVFNSPVSATSRYEWKIHPSRCLPASPCCRCRPCAVCSATRSTTSCTRSIAATDWCWTRPRPTGRPASPRWAWPSPPTRSAPSAFSSAAPRPPSGP